MLELNKVEKVKVEDKKQFNYAAVDNNVAVNKFEPVNASVYTKEAVGYKELEK